MLFALCKGSNGKLYPSAIDLNDHYMNDRGSLDPGAAQFFNTARNVWFEIVSNEALLHGDLDDGDGRYRAAKVDISSCILN